MIVEMIGRLYDLDDKRTEDSADEREVYPAVRLLSDIEHLVNFGYSSFRITKAEPGRGKE